MSLIAGKRECVSVCLFSHETCYVSVPLYNNIFQTCAPKEHTCVQRAFSLLLYIGKVHLAMAESDKLFAVSPAEPLLGEVSARGPVAAAKRAGGGSGVWSEDGAGLGIALSLFAFSLVLSFNRQGSRFIEKKGFFIDLLLYDCFCFQAEYSGLCENAAMANWRGAMCYRNSVDRALAHGPQTGHWNLRHRCSYSSRYRIYGSVRSARSLWSERGLLGHSGGNVPATIQAGARERRFERRVLR
jgi:hypothetical protein